MDKTPEGDLYEDFVRIRIQARTLVDDDPEAALRLIKEIELVDPAFPGIRALRSRADQVLLSRKAAQETPAQPSSQAREVVPSVRPVIQQANKQPAGTSKKNFFSRAFWLTVGFAGFGLILLGAGLAGYSAWQQIQRNTPFGQTDIAQKKIPESQVLPFEQEGRLPLRNDQALPAGFSVISAETLSSLQQVAFRGEAAPSITTSPDGRFACISSNLGTQIFDIREERNLKWFPPEIFSLGCIFSAGSQIAGVQSASTMTVYRLPEWEAVGSFPSDYFAGGGSLHSALSPDGKRIAFAGYQSDKSVAVSIWDIGGDVPLVVSPVNPGIGQDLSIAFTPDSTQVLYLSDSQTIQSIDLAAGPATGTVLQLSQAARSFKMSPDGKNLVVLYMTLQQVDLYDLPARTLISSFPSAGSLGFENFVLNDSLLGVHTGQGIVNLYTPGSLEARVMINLPDAGLLSMNLIADGKILAATFLDGSVQMWETGSGQPYQGLPSDFRLASLSSPGPDGHYRLFGYVDSRLVLWDLETRQAVLSLPHYVPGGITSFSFSPDGQSLAAGLFAVNGAAVWDLETGELERVMSHELDPLVDERRILSLFHLTYTPDGRQIIGKSAPDESAYHWQDCEVLFIDVASSQILPSQLTYDCKHTIAVSPDGRSLYLSPLVYSLPDQIPSAQPQKRELINRELLDARPSRMLAMVQPVQFTRDGRFLVEGEQEGIFRIWETNSWTEVNSGFTTSGEIFSLTLSQDGTRMALGLDHGIIEIHSIPDGALIGTLPDGENPVVGLAFSPDGSLLASSSRGQVSLWDPATYQNKLKITGVYPPYNSFPGGNLPIEGFFMGSGKLAFSPDGRFLAMERISNIVLWGVPK